MSAVHVRLSDKLRSRTDANAAAMGVSRAEMIRRRRAAGTAPGERLIPEGASPTGDLLTTMGGPFEAGPSEAGRQLAGELADKESAQTAEQSTTVRPASGSEQRTGLGTS